MAKSGKSYATGKRGEQDTWTYLAEHGFVRPDSKQRRVLRLRFQKEGLAIQARGFDVVRQEELLGDKLPVLYEVKTCGRKQGDRVSPGFSGFGFTLTGNERHNAKVLGPELYKFIFVNLSSRKHLIVSLDEFFNDKVSRIYPTWSIFIKKDII